MTLRHVRAVQEHTKLDDPIARSIIQVIATDIGYDDSPAYPSYRTIAGRAGCHYNTVAEKVKALCDNGDLIVTKQGKYNYYSLPYDCPDCHSLEGDNKPPIVTSQTVTKEELSHELSQLEQRLSQRLSQAIEELSQTLSQIVIAQGVTEVEVTEEEGSKTHGRKPRAHARGPLGPLSDSPADRRTAALARVCGKDASIPEHRRECEAAAVQLRDYDAEYILARYLPPEEGGDISAWNWFVDDWRKPEQPRPKQVVETIGKRRVKTRASPNGHGEAEPAGFAGIREFLEDMEDS